MELREPDFSRFRRTLLLEGEPDFVPLFDSVHRDVKSAFLGKPLTDLKGEVEFAIAAGYDFVMAAVGLQRFFGLGKHSYYGQEASFATKKPILQAKTAKYSVFTDAEEERAWAEEGKGNITTMEEFENFPWPTIKDFDFSLLKTVGEHLPPGMKVINTVQGVFTPVWLLMGGETFYLSLIDNPGLVAKMFDKITTLQYECIQRIVSFDCLGALRVNDDIAYKNGLLISPGHLREYFFPWLKEVGKLCERKDLPFILHTDGNVYEVLDDIIDAGVNGLHPIEPSAMDIGYLKKKVGDKLCLLGGIDVDLMTRGTPEEVEALVRRNLREIAPGGGYIVGASNSVPEYIPLVNYNAMRETTLNYGGYPISLS